LNAAQIRRCLDGLFTGYMKRPALPSLDPAHPELAKAITQNDRTPFDKALAIESNLAPRFTTTLNLAGTGRSTRPHFLSKLARAIENTFCFGNDHHVRTARSSFVKSMASPG